MKIKAFLYVILSGVLWGTSGLFVNALAAYGFSAFQITALRGSVSLLGLLGYAALLNRGLFRIRLRDLWLFAGIGVSLFGTSGCYFWSLQATSVSTAVVLMYMAPVYVMIVSVLLLGERFTALKGISLACMMVGCCLVSGLIGGFKMDAVGLLMGFLSGISFAAYNLLTKLAARRGIPALTTSLYAFSFMTLTALAVSRPWEILPKLAQSPSVTIPLAIAQAVVTFIVPYTVYTVAMKTLPAGTASALGIVEPMTATVLSVLILHERLTVSALAGIALILGAVFLLGRAETSKKNLDKNLDKDLDKEPENV